jgi:dTDP-4-dehydrorhamnose 3,5-epimerase
MNIIETNLPGVVVVEPKIWGDDRGFFFESYHERAFHDAGITNRFVQDNHSRSLRGTLRGLHYQLPNPQAKLCRVIQGEVLDVAVDIRVGSPHFGQWTSVLLSAENKHQILVPAGFAHGFVVLSEAAEFLYKVDAFYSPADERGIAWDDPGLGIDWQLEKYGVTDLILSAKDKVNPRLGDVDPSLLPRYE